MVKAWSARDAAMPDHLLPIEFSKAYSIVFSSAAGERKEHLLRPSALVNGRLQPPKARSSQRSSSQNRSSR
jgi:hypothetical protein